MPTALSEIRVSGVANDPTHGILIAGTFATHCALGRGGVVRDKREGDGGTPAGSFRLIEVYWRPDRGPAPRTSLAVKEITRASAWCDDPADRLYNRFVTLPYGASHEALWRDDSLYDVLVVLDHNFARPVPGLGSAIFLHVAAPDFAPTKGCVAIPMAAMLRVLGESGPETMLVVM